MNAISHTARRKRTATMYSGPSGQAATMSTSEPNSTATPKIDSTRPSHVGPSDASDASDTSSSPAVPPSLPAGVVDVGPGSAPPPGFVGGGGCCTVKLKLPSMPGSPVVSLTCQLTWHVPGGIGASTSTVSVSALSPVAAGLRSVNGLLSPPLPQAIESWLASPISSVNVSTICDGDEERTAPSAGSDSSSVFCAWA